MAVGHCGYQTALTRLATGSHGSLGLSILETKSFSPAWHCSCKSLSKVPGSAPQWRRAARRTKHCG